MMSVARIAWSVLCVVLVSSCASTYKLQPELGVGQKKAVDYGKDVLISTKKHTVSIVPIDFLEKTNQKPGVKVAFINRSEKSVMVHPDRITASFNGRRIQTFSVDEVDAEIKKKAERSASLVAFMGALSAGAASYSGGRVETKGTYSGMDSSGQFFSGTYTASGYSAAAAKAASDRSAADTRASIGTIYANAGQETERLGRTRFRMHWMGPYDTFEGVVFFEEIAPSSSSGVLEIDVQIDDEVHSFKMFATKVDY